MPRALFRPEISYDFGDVIGICVGEIKWGCAGGGKVRIKWNLNLSATILEPVISTPSWTKHEGKSDLKVFLLIISFNVSHVFRMSFLNLLNSLW